VIRSTRALGISIAVVLGMAGWGLGAVQLDRPPVAVSASVQPPVEWRLVADVVASQGERLKDGRLLAVRSRRVLDAHAFPAQLSVAGRLVVPGDLVPADVRVAVVDGRDQVERVVRHRLAMRPLLTRVGNRQVVKPRVVVETVGAVSGEVVVRRVLFAPPPVRPRWHGRVVLTFDDGPDPTWTPQVLTLLRQAKVHAVFCLVGREARKHADLVRQVLREGHTLCDHTENHDEHLPADRTAAARLEIARGAEALIRATGVHPVWFRAPGGEWSPAVERIVGEEGMVPLKWTVDPRDWERPRASVIAARVLLGARPGSIILLHDGGGDRAGTVAALRYLLVNLPRLGLTFAEPHPPTPPRTPAPTPTPRPTPTPAPTPAPSP